MSPSWCEDFSSCFIGFWSYYITWVLDMQKSKLIRPEEAILAKTMLLIQFICQKKLQFSDSFDKFAFWLIVCSLFLAFTIWQIQICKAESFGNSSL